MPDPITHLALRRDVVEKDYPRGTDEYLAGLLSLYVPDSDLICCIYPRLRQIYRKHKNLMHHDAGTISDICSRIPRLRPMRFLKYHELDDNMLHPSYIDPLSEQLVYDFDILKKNGHNGRDAAHGLLEVVIGSILLDNDPNLGDDMTASLKYSKNYSRDFAALLSTMYDKSQKTFEHALLLTRFIYRHFDKNRNRLSRAMISYSLGEDGPHVRRLKKMLLNAVTYKLENVPVNMIPEFTCSLVDLIEDFTSAPQLNGDYMNHLIRDARELVLRFDREKISNISGAKYRRLGKKDRVLPYLYGLGSL